MFITSHVDALVSRLKLLPTTNHCVLLLCMLSHVNWKHCNTLDGKRCNTLDEHAYNRLTLLSLSHLVFVLLFCFICFIINHN